MKKVTSTADFVPVDQTETFRRMITEARVTTVVTEFNSVAKRLRNKFPALEHWFSWWFNPVHSELIFASAAHNTALFTSPDAPTTNNASEAGNRDQGRCQRSHLPLAIAIESAFRYSWQHQREHIGKLGGQHIKRRKAKKRKIDDEEADEHPLGKAPDSRKNMSGANLKRVVENNHSPGSFKVGAEVKCLATQFDTKGDKGKNRFSAQHFNKHKRKWCFGKVVAPLPKKGDVYEVRWEKDRKPLKSAKKHLSLR